MITSPSGQYSKKLNISTVRCQRGHGVNSISLWTIREFRMNIQLIYMISMALDLFGIWIIFIICHAVHMHVVTLAQLAWSTGTWTSEAIFLATASQCEACSCTLAMDDLQQILWGWVLLCHQRQQNVLCVRKAPSPISGIHSFIIPHPCHDLEVGPERMVFHSTWRVGGSFSGLTNAFEEITFLVSTSLRRECRDWPSLPPH